MAEDKFTIIDLTELRRIFTNINKEDKEYFASSDRVKIQNMRSAVDSEKKPTL